MMSTAPTTPHGGLACALLCSLLWLAGCETSPPAEANAPPAVDPEYASTYSYSSDSLYDRLGGADAIARVVEAALERAHANPQIESRFANANLPLLQARLTEQIAALSGGPETYRGLDMKSAHRGMGISDKEFDALASDILAAMTNLGVGKRERRELMSHLAAMREQIVERGSMVVRAEPAHQGLSSEERIVQLEARVATLERALAAGGRAAPVVASVAPIPGAPSMSTPISTPIPVASSTPVPAAAVAGAPLGLVLREWLPEEKAFARDKLVAAYTSGNSKKPEPRPDLLGKPLSPSRFFSGDGRVLDINSYRGKRVVLVVLRGFKNQVCLHCSSQTIALTENEAEFKRRDAQIVLVYPGAAESVPLFLKAMKAIRENVEPPFPIALDVELRAVKELDISATLAKPTTLIADREGVVRYAYVGSEPGSRPSVRELLAFLDSIP